MREIWGGGAHNRMYFLFPGRSANNWWLTSGGRKREGLKTITIFVLIFFVDPFWKFKGNLKIWAGCFEGDQSVKQFPVHILNYILFIRYQ